MLDGIRSSPIVVGAYTDNDGGICPMLAAHRNGGRTSLASFAVAWDAFTDARRPRLATRREVSTLRSYLEISLLRDEQAGDSVAALAEQIRAERATTRPRRTLGLRVPDPAQGQIAIKPQAQITIRRDRARALRERLRLA